MHYIYSYINYIKKINLFINIYRPALIYWKLKFLKIGKNPFTYLCWKLKIGENPITYLTWNFEIWAQAHSWAMVVDKNIKAELPLVASPATKNNGEELLRVRIPKRRWIHVFRNAHLHFLFFVISRGQNPAQMCIWTK